MPRRNVYLLLIVALVSLVCYHKSDSANRSRYGRMFTTFCQVMDEIEQHYVQKKDPREVFEAGLTGMAESLGDPYSRYFPPKKFSDLREELDSEFGGIGVNVTWDEKHKTLRVASPLVGTPAHKAGLIADDLIVEADGTSLVGKALEDAVGLIKGKPGTDVHLKVLREEETLDFIITRDQIEVPTIMGDRFHSDGTWDFMLEGQPGIGYIRLARFGHKTPEQLDAALASLKKHSLKGLVLDLRHNPGGLLDAAVKICDLFVRQGTIVSIRGRQGSRSKPEIYQASGAGTYAGFPIAVLVNGYSASASEILSACLQDHGRAVIVGERSYGKGSVQNVIPLEDRTSALKLTVATYWRPSGKNIHRHPDDEQNDEWGVKPNEGYEVELDKDAAKKMNEHRRQRDVFHPDGEPVPSLDLETDPQLKKAVEYLKESLNKPLAQPMAA